MRKRLLPMIISILSIVQAYAANIGYCAGENAKSGSFSVGGNTEISGAIYLTSDYLEPFVGKEIKALRGALASKINIDRLTIWIREDLDGDNVLQAIVTSATDPALTKGWMEVSVDNPYEIKGGKGLYLGMTYHQKAETKAFSLVGNGFENSFLASTDESGWKDCHDEGILSVEAVVEGNSDRGFDLGLLDATLDYSSRQDVNIASVRVSNQGSNVVKGFSLEFIYANNSDEVIRRHYDEILAPGDKTDVRNDVPKVEDVFSNPLTVRIAAIDGGEDSYSGNNETVAKVPSRKKVLVEEFTTERCSNCPRVAKSIHEICEEEAYKDCVVVLCHHAGYYTDWLTQPCDEEIGWLYGCGFAPAVMYDRTKLPQGQMADTPDNKDLRDNFDRQLAEAPSIGISLTMDMDKDSGLLHVSVALKREKAVNMTDPRISVYLTEDNIKPIGQSGDSDKTYVHQHVIRAYNSTWGDPIEWNGSDFSRSYAFELDSKWKVSDLKVIAFVNNYDSENMGNNKIDNAESCVVVTETNAVGSVDDEAIQSLEYYDLTGRKSDASMKGFVVKVIRYCDGSVRSFKKVNR